MKYPRTFALMTLALLLVAGLWSAAFGQTNEGNLANIVGGGSSVRFEVVGQNAGVTLTITAPDGRSFTREYKVGVSPGFEFGDKSLPDGNYGYELRLRPALTVGQREALKAARGNDDDPEAERAARKRPVLPNMIQSGTFAVINGQVVVAGLSENQRTAKASAPPASKPAGASGNTEGASGNTATRLRNHRASLLSNLMFDIVHADDVIIQGSLCVGFDCVSGESFGFDTIRLKENSTRIKFQDTSVGAFPSNDWQLTANDSASGGASKFSIEDITGSKVPFTITAGATTNSIFVDSVGRLGLRTSTPVLDIHAATSNTPALRLEQNNSGGFTAQTWDVGANEANFFVRDVTSGSRLPFRIRPGAPTSSIDISSTGSVGVGTASPSALGNGGSPNILNLHSSGSYALATLSTGVTTNGSTAGNITFGTSGASSSKFSAAINSNLTATSTTNASGDLLFSTFSAGTANNAMYINSSGNIGINTTIPDQRLSVSGDASKSAGGGSWQVFSDQRLKNIKGRFNSGLSAVMQLQPIRFQYKRDNALGLQSELEQVGFGAQDLQKVIPEAVTTNANGYLQVNNDPIIWTMLNAIKDQQKEIEQLKGQIKKLQTTSHRRRK